MILERAIAQGSGVGVYRRLPVGAEVQVDGGVHFRVWAPRSKTVGVMASQPGCEQLAQLNELTREEGGYFSGLVSEAGEGWLYKIKLDSGVSPDPASRFQPRGPHGFSQIIDPAKFRWTDQSWRGVQPEGQVIYEMHVGTFTSEGTYGAAMKQLAELAEAGITVIELMPVAEFSGRFGWGYDGVDLFAPTHLYGSPDALRAFINRAHEVGLGVILDVVYNHFGPDGCYLREFSQDYVTDRYKNEWGEAVNFDGVESGPVREFFTSNAVYWIDEFHMDGFRFDATQQIFDSSPEHILRAIARRARDAAKGRSIILTSENETQNTRLVRAPEEGGYGFDALWNDDFHHAAIVALTGRNEAYYSDFKGSPQEFVSAMKWGYLYQGQWYEWQKKRRGASTVGLKARCFVNFLENHDQVANSLRGARVHQMSHPGAFRAMTALMLLGPGTPLIFQGQEFGSSRPFLYFADHNAELAQLVNEGRMGFLSQFPRIACPESRSVVAPPESEETFRRCKLDFSERASHAEVYQLHKDLLRLRKGDPAFWQSGRLDGAVLSDHAFVLRYWGGLHGDRLLMVNLGMDLPLSPMPEPLLAAPEDHIWELLWSSEDPAYGGYGTPVSDTAGNWRLPAYSAIVLTAVRNEAKARAQLESTVNRRTA